MNIVYIFGGMILFLMLAVIVSYTIYRASFKNRAFIARQTGNDVGSVIWIQDKFKVRNINGEWVIVFRNLRMKTAGVPGSLWSFIFKPKDVPKELRMTKEQWEAREMGKKIQRGLFLYESSDGELSPMGIQKDPFLGTHFKVLTQDNKRWLINEIRDINNLTRNRTKDMLLLIAAIVACAVLAVIFIFGIIYMNEQATKSLAANQAACTTYIDRIMNYTSTVQEGERKNWIINAANTVGG